MRKNLLKYVGFAGCVLALASCSGTKETLGLTPKAPDEFAVVKRAPLAMPPDYALRPPEPGAPRPQEATPDAQAREVVFGGAQPAKTQTAASASTESLLLEKTGADQASPAIRSTVDKEATQVQAKDKPVTEKLLGWTGLGDSTPPATVVDAPAEAARIKNNQTQGKPVTTGDTPSKDQ